MTARSATLSASPASAHGASSSAGADSLIYGTSWGGSGGTVEITYSFPDFGSSWPRPYGDFDEPRAGFQPLSASQEAAVREALELWAGVADIRFVEVVESGSDVGDLRFARTSASPSAHAYLPQSGPPSGDVWLGPSFLPGMDYTPGSYGFFVMVHEIGHALGLKHPHEPGGIGGVLAAGADWIGSTVMSYRSLAGDRLGKLYSNDLFPKTPMALDIAAIQELYGANDATGAGNTLYAWAPGERVFETIYDTGGIDTIDWSNQSSSALIDLRPGAWSELGAPVRARGGKSSDTLALADGTLIENAVGGSGNDKIWGNDLANLLDGGSGKDRLWGLGGDDILVAGPGKDRLDGGDGLDVAVFAGDSADFKISVKKNGKITVIDKETGDGNLGKNKLFAIEILEFDDVLLEAGPGKTLLPLGSGQAVAAAGLDSLVNDGHMMV
ncbi:M10 family metallopeptidase [Geminicoccaceae bacterium 1502E]|nr:M10 family metallopeptidase [Geminicoccaceae bacterium 1502E]